MTYAVKEVFYTLQGEGANSGRPAVFCRFSGCNLWTGREEDREHARCNFCDTDFVGTDGLNGGKYKTPQELADKVASLWPVKSRIATLSPRGRPLVVCTGGEPLLQLDAALTSAFHQHGFEVAVETNGTQPRPDGIDHLCVSPKGTTSLLLRTGDELKLIYPQEGAPPSRFVALQFRQFFLQPMDGPDVLKNTKATVEYCMAHPQWRLSLQTHKYLGIP